MFIFQKCHAYARKSSLTPHNRSRAHVRAFSFPIYFVAADASTAPSAEVLAVAASLSPPHTRRKCLRPLLAAHDAVLNGDIADFNSHITCLGNGSGAVLTSSYRHARSNGGVSGERPDLVTRTDKKPAAAESTNTSNEAEGSGSSTATATSEATKTVLPPRLDLPPTIKQQTVSMVAPSNGGCATAEGRRSSEGAHLCLFETIGALARDPPLVLSEEILGVFKKNIVVLAKSSVSGEGGGRNERREYGAISSNQGIGGYGPEMDHAVESLVSLGR